MTYARPTRKRDVIRTQRLAHRLLVPAAMTERAPTLLSLALAFACAACAHDDPDRDPNLPQLSCAADYAPTTPLAPDGSGLHISEVVSSNDGVAVDELGETDDWIELANDGSAPVRLANYALTDSGGKPKPLPDITLAPGQVVVLWADDSVKQGALHLGLKLAAEGEQLTLWANRCTPIERVAVPALQPDQAFARPAGGTALARCRYATPGRANPATCAPPLPPELPADVSFSPFTLPATFPALPGPLALSELALRPAGFIEVRNTSQNVVALAGYALRLAPISAAAMPPNAAMGNLVAWPKASIGPGERLLVPVSAEQTEALEASPEFEGVATLFGPDGVALDRAEFMHWPSGAVLVRAPETASAFRLCTSATPGAENVCMSEATRTIGDRLRSLQTSADFDALATGGVAIGQTAVKFVVDMERGDAVHLLGTQRWALHYTFVRERLFGEPALDRCDPVQAAQFEDEWYTFSEREYFRVGPRRFLLGTLIRHANGLHTVEFAAGDVIEAPQMRRAFLAVVAQTLNPRAWLLRPAAATQVPQLKRLDGSLPIVSGNAPFTNLTYQPLTTAVGYGVLRFVPTVELDRTPIATQTILVTDDVPNDVPFVGGLITEAFQTPLAHVNVLSQARGTPNMALRGARTAPELAPLFGKLVRLEVGAQQFSVREATADEASAYWETQRPSGPRVVAPGDLSRRALLPLAGRGVEDLPAIGAKAAQFAELYQVQNLNTACADAPFQVPPDAFAIPVVHYAEHFAASGARDLLRQHRDDPAFRADPARRATALAEVRAAMLRHPVAAALRAEVEAEIRGRFGAQRVRFRSSSNVEDLPTFNGAGLHTSMSAALGDDERTIDDGLRTVWASLWNLRAYDERESANLDHDSALMGILVHRQAAGEAAQGVAISRDLLDLTRDDIFYINAQIGEAAVTNPAPGITTEQLLYTSRSGTPETSYQTRSSLTNSAPVLTASDLHGLECALVAVHQHFQPLLDPMKTNRLFAIQIEFKIERDRTLVVKQARPQPFRGISLPADCR